MSNHELIKKTFESQVNINPLLEKGYNHKIVSRDDAKNALQMSLQARKLKNTLEKSRKEIIKPHLDYQRDINKLAKEYLQKLDDIETHLKKSVKDWIETASLFEDEKYLDTMITEDGTMTMKKEWSFEIEDISKIPREYLKVDETAIKKAIKSGVRTLSGVKIFEQDVMKTRVCNIYD